MYAQQGAFKLFESKQSIKYKNRKYYIKAGGGRNLKHLSNEFERLDKNISIDIEARLRVNIPKRKIRIIDAVE